ncbi:MAG TPA: VWA domain-containing protein [Pyrinomonadaceae bacterium]|nr:VWA domain-containing protein [Pyrinomonadaceae bacterium]
MRFAVRLFLLATVFALAALSVTQHRAEAQGSRNQQPRPTPTPQEQDDLGPVTVREVRLPITVLDKKEQPVSGLTRTDFLVFEDKQQQRIEGFIDERTGVPVHVAVLMDISESTAGKLEFQKTAAKDFIYTVVRARKDRAAFGVFDENLQLIQDFTERHDLLDRAVDSVKKPGTNTALWDAVWLMCDEKMRGVTGRRVIVIITDGDDTASRARLKDAIEIAQATETIVFAISTKAGLSGVVPGVEMGTPKDGGDRELERLCAETGGRAFFIGDRINLERAFTRVARELRSQYIVTYKPTREFDGSYRRIEVKLAGDRDGLKVRTRRGYTASRQ